MTKCRLNLISDSTGGLELSQSDIVKVAWHGVPGDATISVPSRRERCDLRVCGQCFRTRNGAFKIAGQGYHLRPYPTGRINGLGFPGTSCQATIVSSLRDTRAFLYNYLVKSSHTRARVLRNDPQTFTNNEYGTCR